MIDKKKFASHDLYLLFKVIFFFVDALYIAVNVKHRFSKSGGNDNNNDNNRHDWEVKVIH